VASPIPEKALTENPIKRRKIGGLTPCSVTACVSFAEMFKGGCKADHECVVGLMLSRRQAFLLSGLISIGKS